MATIATAVAIAACSNGDGAGGWGPGSGEPTGGVSGSVTLEVTTGAPSIGSDGGTAATITAFLKDGPRGAMANQSVAFVTSDEGAVIEVVSGQTDATGAATAKLRVTDPANRAVTVTARSGDLSRSVEVAVVGTALELSGPSSVAVKVPTEFVIGLRDSAGTALAGKTVAVTSAAGNTLSAPAVTTDKAGQARVIFTGTKDGNDILTVTALGASAAASLQVASSQISFASPASGKEIPVGTQQMVTVNYSLGGVPQEGVPIQFSATRGSLNATSVITDAAGNANVTVQSDTAGVATIVAVSGTLASAHEVEFVGKAPAKMTLQASPADVGVNLSADSANASELIAAVLDAAGNPVKGQAVNFSIVSDPSGGRIEPASGTTDSSGVAAVTYFPGASPSGAGLIEVRAEVPGKGVSAITKLTASSQDLVVRAGTSNAIEEPDLTTYSMPWSALVTDPSGKAVAGAGIQASLVAVRYLKGTYVRGPERWSRNVSISCIGEDINQGTGNGNSVLDAGEDTNGDGQLTPGEVATVVVSSEGALTDATGMARVRIRYPQKHAGWVEVRLRVEISTAAGATGADQRSFVLPIPALDLAGPTPPLGTPSPYGQVADCSTTY